MPDPQVLLALALVAIYLIDCVQLLSVGDAVVIARGTRLRQVSFGSSFELAGRRPYVPNPFTPFWPALTIQWTSAPSGVVPATATAEMTAFLEATRPISRLAALVGLCMVLLGPALLAAGSEGLFLLTAALGLILAVSACALMLARRQALGLKVTQVASLAAVALLCLPCAANLGRAIAKHRGWTLTVSDIPALGFDAAQGERIRGTVATFLLQVRRLFPEGTAEFNALTNQMQLVQGAPREPS